MSDTKFDRKPDVDKKLIVPYADYLRVKKPDFEYNGDPSEIVDLVRCLNLPSANSVKIIAKRGAGATTLMDALAHHQHDDFMPDDFMLRPLFRFNGTSLFNTSDTKAIEARFQGALDEMRRHYEQRGVKPVLLIDDGCNLLANAPTYVVNNLIDATVTADYLDTVITVDAKKESEFNAKHPEFVNSFTSKHLKEPTDEQILKVLKARAKIHAKGGVIFDDEALKHLVKVTQRFKAMYDTAQPNRSIRLMDSAATAFHIEVHSKPPGSYLKEKHHKGLTARIEAAAPDDADLDSLKSQAETLRIELEDASTSWKEYREKIKKLQGNIREFDGMIADKREQIVKLDEDTKKVTFEGVRKLLDGKPEGDKDLQGRTKEDIMRMDQETLLKFVKFDLNVRRNPKVAELNQEIGKHEASINYAQGELTKLGDNKHGEIAIPTSEIDKAAASETKMPVGGVAEKLKENLRNGVALMEETVFGQTHVIVPIVDSLGRAAAGLNDPDRPLGNYILAGPPGVGKTFIGEQLAVKFFGSKKFLAQIDMERFREKHTVSSLLGAPPGYAGYGTKGELIRIAQENPYCVLLLDEIEKAHPDIRQALLKVKGSGRLVGFDGEEADFRNVIIVETTNYGQDIWQSHDFDTAEKLVRESMKNDVSVFSPEYLDRADAILCTKRLDSKALTKIAMREISELKDKTKVQNPNLALDIPASEVEAFVTEQCAGFSGRRTKMTMLELLGTPLKDLLLRSTAVSGTLKGRYDADAKTLVCDFGKNVLEMPVQPKSSFNLAVA